MDTGTCFDKAGLVEGFATDPAYRQRRVNCKKAYDYGMYS